MLKYITCCIDIICAAGLNNVCNWANVCKVVEGSLPPGLRPGNAPGKPPIDTAGLGLLLIAAIVAKAANNWGCRRPCNEGPAGKLLIKFSNAADEVGIEGGGLLIPFFSGVDRADPELIPDRSCTGIGDLRLSTSAM